MHTKLQWAKKGYLPKSDAAGELRWTNRFCQHIAVYYTSDEVYEASKEELNEFFKPRREREKELRIARKELRKQQFEEEKEWCRQDGYDKAKEKAQQHAAIVFQKLMESQEPVATDSLEQKDFIVIDTETTGLSRKLDDILQLSIIDPNGNVLFDDYFFPFKNFEWIEAEKVNHISYEIVKDKPLIFAKIKQIQAIIDSADKIVGYNISFDTSFLRSYGIEIDWKKEVDFMYDFAKVYGEWNDYFGSYKWQSLGTCARWYEYDWSTHGEAHNALADCFATLHCYKAYLESENEEE